MDKTKLILTIVSETVAFGMVLFFLAFVLAGISAFRNYRKDKKYSERAGLEFEGEYPWVQMLIVTTAFLVSTGVLIMLWSNILAIIVKAK